MENDIRNSNVTPLRSTFEGNYHSYVQSIANEQNRALVIEVDFKHCCALAQTEPGIVQALNLEISLWSKILGKREVISIIFSQPTPAIAPFELTHLIHSLASNFKLSPSKLIKIVYLPLHEITSENLALLKGLGFNQIRILVEAEDLENIDKFQQQTRSLKSFNFDIVGLHIDHTDCVGTICQQIKELRNFIADYIALGHQNLGLEDDSAFEEQQNQIQRADRLQLGPEGCSHLGNSVIRNFCSPKKYIDAIRDHQLPIHTG